MPSQDATSRQPSNWVAALRDMAGPLAAPEYCDLCSARIASRHTHLIEPETRRISCACRACALLFANSDAGRYRCIPTDATALEDFQLSDAQWDGLMIPIGMAFFFRSSHLGRMVALYPGPAGATESTLDLEAWDDLVDANPVLRDLQDDVEALLINRVDHAREYFRVPIDRCYELVGRIRRNWHGISGGQEAHVAIDAFFEQLRGTMQGRERAHA